MFVFTSDVSPSIRDVSQDAQLAAILARTDSYDQEEPPAPVTIVDLVTRLSVVDTTEAMYIASILYNQPGGNKFATSAVLRTLEAVRVLDGTANLKHIAAQVSNYLHHKYITGDVAASMTAFAVLVTSLEEVGVARTSTMWRYLMWLGAYAPMEVLTKILDECVMTGDDEITTEVVAVILDTVEEHGIDHLNGLRTAIDFGLRSITEVGDMVSLAMTGDGKVGFVSDDNNRLIYLDALTDFTVGDFRVKWIPAKAGYLLVLEASPGTYAHDCILSGKAAKLIRHGINPEIAIELARAIQSVKFASADSVLRLLISHGDDLYRRAHPNSSGMTAEDIANEVYGKKTPPKQLVTAAHVVLKLPPRLGRFLVSTGSGDRAEIDQSNDSAPPAVVSSDRLESSPNGGHYLATIVDQSLND